MLKKIGSPEKLTIIKQSAFQFDVNLITKLVKDKVQDGKISLDQLHEAVKSLGILEYSSEDMNSLIGLLQSSGVSISNS